MKKCQCCKSETPESKLFKYEQKEVCEVCFVRIQEYRKKGTIYLTKEQIKEIEEENIYKENWVKNLDFTTLPRDYLEKLLTFYKKNYFSHFKYILEEFENHKKQTEVTKWEK